MPYRQVGIASGLLSLVSRVRSRLGALTRLFSHRDLKKTPLTAVIDIFVCPVGNAIEQRLAAKVKSLRDRASELLKISRSQSRTDSASLEDPMVSIPIAVLLQPQQQLSNGIRRLAACYYVRSGSAGGMTGPSPSSPVLGEVSLDLIAAPEAFVQATTSIQLYQNYLSMQAEGHGWRRQWGVIANSNLHLFDFQRHEKPSTGFKNIVDLTKAVSIKHYGEHECGLQNVVKVTFDDHHELLAYADDETSAVRWADAIHRAVWNQPYFVAS